MKPPLAEQRDEEAMELRLKRANVLPHTHLITLRLHSIADNYLEAIKNTGLIIN